MAKAFIDDTNLTAIADAIRAQNGSTDTYLPSEMATAIEELPVLDTSDATATASDMASGVTAYVNGEKVTGSIPTWSPNTSSYISSDIAVSNVSYRDSNAILFLIAQRKFIGDTPDSGILGTYVSTPLSMFGDATSSDVVSGKTFTGASGVKVTGTATLGTDTSDATATEEQIISGATAYVNGTKITGTLVLQNYYTGTTTPESTTGSDGDLYFKVNR